jgi:hypothetical protein
MSRDVATGITIVFGTSGFEAEILGFDADEVNRPALDSSHLGTPNNARTFKPGKLYDPGGVSMELGFDPKKIPPITGDAETITITFLDGTTLAFEGFVDSYKWGGELEGLLTGSCHVKASGPLTWTPGA